MPPWPEQLSVERGPISVGRVHFIYNNNKRYIYIYMKLYSSFVVVDFWLKTIVEARPKVEWFFWKCTVDYLSFKPTMDESHLSTSEGRQLQSKRERERDCCETCVYTTQIHCWRSRHTFHNVKNTDVVNDDKAVWDKDEIEERKMN